MTERVTRTDSAADVIVIGAGLAGLTAAVQAVKAGARVRLIAQGWGQQIVTPGWISVWDAASGDVVGAASTHTQAQPEHPYALAGSSALHNALSGFQAIAEEIDLPYRAAPQARNLRLPTMLGATQTPMLAPEGLAAGDAAFEASAPVLIVGFSGWRDFHPQLMVGNLQQRGIAARAVTIDLPRHDTSGSWDAWPVDLARSFDRADFRKAVIRQIQAHSKGVAAVGLPAVLGLDHPAAVRADLEAACGCPVFEIATLPPSVPGLRLSTRLRRWLLRQRARVQIGHPVVHAHVENGRCTSVEVGALGHTNTFRADAYILATGGLYNGGIQSDTSGRLWEPLFDLPALAPPGEGRANWTHERLLVADGHPVHRDTGVRVDAAMRPINATGEPLLANVYAAGHLLAGTNPLADGCAEGVALATAFRAIQCALNLSE